MKYIYLLIYLFYSCAASAHTVVSTKNLKGALPPAAPGLLDGRKPIVVDKVAAIQLGKALFWDTNLGNNGVACATCHFHAGSDRRVSNQLNPGQLHLNNPDGQNFAVLLPDGGGANHTLKLDNFPFYKLQNPDDINSGKLFETDDVVGSAGVYAQTHNKLGFDTCTPKGDNVFHLGGAQVRQVTKRNAPTVINAAFNRRNFWDGRANNEFNGVSVFGPRDTKARIWIKNGNRIIKNKLRLLNSALASQAVGPPADMIEMSCDGRTFKNIAKKLLPKRPLETQEVHIQDSVLANMRHSSGLGLSTTYDAMIQKAFNPIYWSETIVETLEGMQYTQTESNFSLYLGLSIQLYEDTLISDESKLDVSLQSLDQNGFPSAFTEQEKQGALVFADAHCDLCHSGPTFTSATNPRTFGIDADNSGDGFVNRIELGPSSSNNLVDFTLVDIGFFNTSVVPNDHDIGLGGKDPWGHPLSYSQQYVDYLINSKNKFVDNFLVKTCGLTNRFVMDYNKSELKADKYGCNPAGLARVPKPAVAKKESMSLDGGRLSVSTTGAFKVPTLRNVELTGPYMHNGGMKSLEEVVDFYNRGGNYHNRRHPDTLVFPQGMTASDKTALVAFLKTLTDDRVRWEKAPFDHPSIRVSQGHASTSSFGLADDNELDIPAVGAAGRSEAEGPLRAFDSYLK